MVTALILVNDDEDDGDGGKPLIHRNKYKGSIASVALVATFSGR